jgi:predicted transcriptional regulator
LIDLDTDELRTLAERILQLAERRAPAIPQQTGRSFINCECNISDDALLADVASKEIKRRAARMRFLPADLFAEGGWAILLDLFVHEQSRRPVSVKSACIASNIPATTALRQIAALIECGLVCRTASETDKRAKFLHLTEKGRDALRATLHSYV